MAGFPSGNGSERIKYEKLTTVSDSDQTLITGVALHIYTVLSVIVCETTGNAEEIRMALYDSDGTSNAHWLMLYQPIGAWDTFVWNDKFSFDGDKKLRIRTTNSADLDVTITYIDQDWT
tara:strand:- start:90 stop:446 length:357 start_codon:yes stop_codon:yes gene_type:complete